MFAYKVGGEVLTGTGVELVASNGKPSAEETEQILSEYPDLIPAAGGFLLQIYHELKRANY